MKFKFKLDFDYTDSKLNKIFRKNEIYDLSSEKAEYAEKLKFNGIKVFEKISKNENKEVSKKDKKDKSEKKDKELNFKIEKQDSDNETKDKK